MNAKLATHIETEANAVVIAMDQDGGQQLIEAVKALLDENSKRIVVDMTAVAFINSINIAGIITARNQVDGAGGKMTLADLQAPVRSIFHTLRLGRLFDLELDKAGALSALDG